MESKVTDVKFTGTPDKGNLSFIINGKWQINVSGSFKVDSNGRGRYLYRHCVNMDEEWYEELEVIFYYR